MPATSSITAALKAALFTRLSNAAELRELDVDVSYSPKMRDAPRRHLYLGKAVFEQEYRNHKGSSSRLTREETVIVNVWIEAWAPGAEQQEMDELAFEIGAVVEHLLAGDANLTTDNTPDVPGLMYGGVAGGELDPFDVDGACGALLSYQLRFLARLT